MGTYNYTFKSVVFESVKVKSVKIKKSSFVRRFENDTFESVFLKSVEIESVVVSAHPQCQGLHNCKVFFFFLLFKKNFAHFLNKK